MGKVEEKRAKKLKNALEKLKKADFEKNITESKRLEKLINHLLDQVQVNQERKNRKYGLLSLDYQYNEENSFISSVPNNLLSPLEQVIASEEVRIIFEAVLSLSEIDRTIVIEHYLYNASYRLLSKKLGISDKTVKKHLIKATEVLKCKLKELI
ncbi:sigma factor-like helix-turn-helix DNA-binding protein [Lactobacillus sp.]|uniref:RNA polymerase sigma factor n=1 Tax=Lactobacillus sp. TaxID=1591 RepID=UPI0025EFD54C|nr:sigma factor-like helix-turn-helix DNA-binding protein [Lactobacillus sp.]MCO6533165.1 sigma-70 family RNA polymerase sigma factor [Lactobacillus sp.]